MLYGRRTATKDLDVTTSWAPENLARLAQALRQIEARPPGVDGERLGIDVTNPDELAAPGSLGLVTASGDLDVLLEPDGAPPYVELRARATDLEVRGIVVPVCSREDLIAMKRATDARELRVWRRAVERVAEARGVLPADGLPVVVDDLAAALGELGQFGRDG